MSYRSLPLWLCALMLLALPCFAAPIEPQPDNPPADEDWSFHGQATLIGQGYPGFSSPYQGQNSLPGKSEGREYSDYTLFLGARLPWKGGSFYFDPEVTQGLGIGNTTGMAAYPNNESGKAGAVAPEFNAARVYIRQTFGLDRITGGDEQETLKPDANQLGDTVDVSRLTLWAGKMQVIDIFDDNAYAHDSRTQFLNTALVDAAAYDYPSDVKGYTVGGAAELNQKDWALRYGYFLVPVVSNSPYLDDQFLKYGSSNLEYEQRYNLWDQGGKFRVLGFANSAYAGSFSNTVANSALNNDITQTRQERMKYGFVLNLEQTFNDNLGVFSRYSWNDGQEENMAYADIDSSFSLGASLKGANWNRPDDTLGIGGALNQLSDAEKEYIARGGTGIFIGDGRLNYASEALIETYYNYQIIPELGLTFDYQFAVNPAYNADRGPVNIFAGRLHAAF